MLSYNKKNINNLFEEIINRIDRNLEKSIYIKQDNQQACQNVSEEHSEAMSREDESRRSTDEQKSMLLKQVRTFHVGGIAGSDSYYHKSYNKEVNENVSNPMIVDTLALKNLHILSGFTNTISNFGKEGASQIGNLLPRIKMLINGDFTSGFGTRWSNLVLDNHNNSITYTDKNDKVNHINGIIMSIKLHLKRITAVNDHEMSEGERKAYEKWYEIPEKPYMHGNGLDMKDENWEAFLKDFNSGKTDVDFFDKYEMDGDKRILNAENQAPKGIIGSVHNLNNVVIRNAVEELAILDEAGIPLLAKILSEDENIRKSAINELREKVYETHKLVNTATSKEGDNYNPKFDGFLHVLERGETPRVINNLTHVLVHGEVETIKHNRNLIDQIRLGRYEDEQGNVIHFDGNGKNGRTITPDGLDINIARQNALIEQLAENHPDKKPPTFMELAVGFGLTGKKLPIDGVEVNITKQASSPIDHVDLDTFDAFSQAITTASYASGEVDKRTKQNIPTIDFYINKFNLRKENGKMRSQKSIKEDESIRSEIQKMLEVNIMNVDPERKFDWENANDNFLVTSIINNHIIKISNSQSNIDSSKNINSTRIGLFKKGDPINSESRIAYRKEQAKDLLDLRKDLVTQRTNTPEQKAQIKWDRLFRKHLKRAKDSMDADRQWSTQETLGEGGDGTLKGYYNRSMDIHSAFQTFKALKGLGSMWGQQDHHIYGRGDNQANTHFSQVVSNIHQNALHLTDFLPEGIQTNMLNLDMLQQLYKLYLEKNEAGVSNQNNPEYENFQLPDDIISEMVKYFDEEGNHRNLETVEFLKNGDIEEIHRRIVNGEIENIYSDQYVPIFDYDKRNPNYDENDPDSKESKFKVKGYTLKKGGKMVSVTLVPTNKGNSKTREKRTKEWKLAEKHSNFSTPPQQEYMFADGEWNKNNKDLNGVHIGGWSVFGEPERPFIDSTTQKIDFDNFRPYGHVSN